MAVKEKDEDLDLDVEKKSGGGGLNTKTLIIVLAIFAVVVIGAAVGIAMLVAGSHGDNAAAGDKGAKTEQAAPAEAEKNAPAGKVVYVNIDPPFVVNFEDQTLVRYLQIGVSLMTHGEGAKDAIEAQMPLIKSRLLLLFSAQKYDEIKTSEGKQKLQQDALKVVRDVLKDQTGNPYVDQVLFTSFVMQ